MHFLSRKSIALFVLATFLAGIAMYALNPAWLKHELDHDHISLAMTADHDQAAQAGGKPIESYKNFNEAQHKLLHLLSHSAQAPTAWRLAFEKQAVSPAFPPISVPALRAEIEPLFRPPRGTFPA